MPTMDGTIIIVQESRFQMTDDAGASHLFQLSPHAAAEPGQLMPLVARQARVRVKYKAGHNVIAFLAQAIYVLGPEPRR